MLQENKKDSDNYVNEFAKARIEREKARLEAVSREKGEPLPYTPLPDDFYVPSEHQNDVTETEKRNSGKSVSKANRHTPMRESDSADLSELEIEDELNNVIGVEYDRASEEQKSAYDEIVKKGVAPDESIGVARKKPKRGKSVIVNPAWENKRYLALKHSRIIVAALAVTAFTVALLFGIQLFSESHLAERLRYAFRYDADSTSVAFEPIEGHVTIGDSLLHVTDLLGEPDTVTENFYYYGKSYLIIEEEKVVGYYRDPSDNLPITIGYRGENASGCVMVGDSMKNVIYRLGSPEFCFGDNWLYLHCDGYANPSEKPEVNFEVRFDESGRVSACFAVKR